MEDIWLRKSSCRRKTDIWSFRLPVDDWRKRSSAITLNEGTWRCKELRCKRWYERKLFGLPNSRTRGGGAELPTSEVVLHRLYKASKRSRREEPEKRLSTENQPDEELLRHVWGHFRLLPVDVVTDWLAGFLHFKDILSLGCLNSSWKQLADDRQLWIRWLDFRGFTNRLQNEKGSSDGAKSCTEREEAKWAKSTTSIKLSFLQMERERLKLLKECLGPLTERQATDMKGYVRAAGTIRSYAAAEDLKRALSGTFTMATLASLHALLDFFFQGHLLTSQSAVIDMIDCLERLSYEDALFCAVGWWQLGHRTQQGGRTRDIRFTSHVSIAQLAAYLLLTFHQTFLVSGASTSASQVEAKFAALRPVMSDQVDAVCTWNILEESLKSPKASASVWLYGCTRSGTVHYGPQGSGRESQHAAAHPGQTLNRGVNMDNDNRYRTAYYFSGMRLLA